MSAIDPRIARRRRVVAEQGARRRLSKMVAAVAILGALGLGYWATQSELLDVDVITVGPTTHADVDAALAGAGVEPGVSLVTAIRAATTVEALLEESPWVRAATVSVLFPGTVEIEVSERQAAAVVPARSGWQLVAADATILEPVDAPRADLGVIEDPSLVAPGLAFLSVLGDLAPGTVIQLVDTDMWVQRGEVRARVGQPTQIEEKAAAFVALLGEPIPEGWAINLTAPSRPALFPEGQPSPSTEG